MVVQLAARKKVETLLTKFLLAAVLSELFKNYSSQQKSSILAGKYGSTGKKAIKVRSKMKEPLRIFGRSKCRNWDLRRKLQRLGKIHRMKLSPWSNFHFH